MTVQNLLTEVSDAVADSGAATASHVNALLRDVFQSVTTLRQAKRRFADEIAPDFHLFDYLRGDEIGLSRCLADLLDPVSCDRHGKHGQSGLFLDMLIEHLARRVDPVKLASWADSNECHSVQVEAPTDAGRRIDILIRFNNGGLIGIENKPWAYDQPDQLADYAKYLENVSTDDRWLLIYLSNHEPDSGSMTEAQREEYETAGHFLRLSYGEANTWLQASAEKTRSIKVRFFVEELMKFMRHNVSGETDMSEQQEIEKCVLASDDNLESAFLIANSFDSIQGRLMERLKNDLTAELRKHEWQLEDKEGFFDGTRGSHVRVIFSNNQKAHLVFGFGSSNWNNFFIGIASHNEKELNPNVEKGIKEVMDISFQKSQEEDPGYTYQWWIHGDNQAALGNGYRNWNENILPWKAIRNSTLADDLTNIAKKVYEAFYTNGKDALLFNQNTSPINS